MAGSSQYTALLDANVLYPSLLRDILLSLSVQGLYHARWSHLIHEEWTRNLAANRPEIADKLPLLVKKMDQAIPNCLVEGFEDLISSLQLPDPDDRHVLAAAIAGHCDAIVTYNLKDFPAESLAPFGLEVQHPDEFIMNQISLHEFKAVTAFKQVRTRLKNPQVSAEEMLEVMVKRGLVNSAEMLRDAVLLI